MKIYAFEVREDEKEYFNGLSALPGIELILSPEGLTMSNIKTLKKQSDVISLHVPLMKETYHMINADSLAMMKKGVVLINCARGPLTDIKALISGIESEHIGALGLDCIEYEEDIVHRDLRTDILSNRDMAYLRQFKNVIHTQHMAFYTDSAVKSMVDCGVRGLIEMSEKKPCATQLC